MKYKVTIFITVFQLLIFITGCADQSKSHHMGRDNNMKKTLIVIVGDSTVADYPKTDKLRGWGQLLPEFLTSDIAVKNFAKCGESSKSFIKKSLWDEVVKYKADYVLIQFGHNDCPGKGERTTNPETDYRQYLAKYINDVRCYGGKPILVSSMERRNFNKDGTVKLTLDKYAKAVREVGESHNVPVIDLNQKSIELYEKLGDQGSEFLMCEEDRTHFVEAGARIMAEMVASELREKVPELEAIIILADK